MRKLRLPALTAALLGTCVIAVGCGPSDIPDISGGADIGAECRKAADFLPDGDEKSQALEACDKAKGQSFDEITGNAHEQCSKNLSQITDAQLREQAAAACNLLK